ncbi:flavin-containing monooxygenase [Stipitochalara longipes BDJ]|nr:flavin-containing monooxygenase [Stipitochalara longipes BDJ]
MPRGFNDVPGSLPTDRIPLDFDPSTANFPEIAGNALNNLLATPTDNDCLWRDFLCMTGRIRTFSGSERIKKEWVAYSQEKVPRDFKAVGARISRPTPDSSWVDVPFTFITSQSDGLIGNCSGFISFIPGHDESGWKIWMLRTMLENFEGCAHPDDPSPIFRNPTTNSSDQLEHQVPVLIIGAGQAGLSLAGRFGALNIPYILLEKEAEIGYSWTGKYDGVRQHTIREMNNLPFDRTYKASDPELLPANIVAEGFKNYIRKYNINIWLAAKVEKCLTGTGENRWTVSVRKDEKEYIITARHLVLAMGARVSVPDPPKIPNAASFKGTILDIGSFKNSSAWRGKKGIVVGSATGAHDVAQDMLDNHLSSITMVQRKTTPVFPIEWVVKGQSIIYNLNVPPEVADRGEETHPLKVSREVVRINFKAAMEAEKERFDSLERVGFHVAWDASLNDLLVLRGGTYYIDVGTSARIAKGEIRIKSGDAIKRFVENGLEFESGDVLDADVVVFATGYQRDPRIQAATIVGKEVAQAMRMSTGLDQDGELDGNMMPVGKGFWLLGGAVSMARWNSRFVALQIQAELMGKPFPDCIWDTTRNRDQKAIKL